MPATKNGGEKRLKNPVKMVWGVPVRKGKFPKRVKGKRRKMLGRIRSHDEQRANDTRKAGEGEGGGDI